MSRRISDDFFRIIDANLNRAREGMRVCEEVARFLLKDPALTRRCQRARYELRSAARFFHRTDLLTARDSLRDVGRPALRGKASSHRFLADLVSANSQRAQEALRVLEEFCRFYSVRQSKRWAALRFKVYTIEKETLTGLSTLRHR